MSAVRSLSGRKRTSREQRISVGIDPGCVKKRFGEGGAELFSQLPSSERSCQYNRLPHRRNRDGSSTRKLDIGVFTQSGPGTDSAAAAQSHAVQRATVPPPSRL